MKRGETAQTKKCDCKSKKYKKTYFADLAFYNSENSRTKNDSLFNRWSNDSLTNQIRSIRFSG